MNRVSFLEGIGVGLFTGAAVWGMCASVNRKKTGVGKMMGKMSSRVDSALYDMFRTVV